MPHADRIWHNADILTMDVAKPRAQAIAEKRGRIIAIGCNAEVLNMSGPGTTIHDMRGQFIMPGLVESHTHALWGACRDLFDVYVGYTASFGDLLEAVTVRVTQRPKGDVIYGGPWRLDMRQKMGENPKEILDQISTAHPIVILDTSQHVAWCNSIALQVAGIDRETEISGGVIERLPSGEPNGILAENAVAPVHNLIEYTPEQMAKAAQEFVRLFNSYGITAFKEPMATEAELSTYKNADERGVLTLHAATHIVRQSPLSLTPVPFETMERLRRDYASENVRTSFAKLFLDGVAPGHTASFIAPYLSSSGYDVASHQPDATLLMTPEDITRNVVELDARGFTVKMHTVGDNAVRKALDAIETARNVNGDTGLRHETAHTVFITDEDIHRFKTLNAVAEMSPKMWFPNPATPAQIAVLGEARVQRAHPIADLLSAGAEMTYASDWPASAPDANPWPGLSGMLTRRNCDPGFPGTLAPAQAIGLHDTLRVFTLNGARSLGMGSETGSLTIGKWADFIVLDKPLTDIDPLEIGQMEVIQTVWKGLEVFSR